MNEQSEAEGARAGRLRPVVLVSLVALVALVGWGFTATRSLPKASLETRLAGLPGNGAMQLERRALSVPGEPEELELVLHVAPALEPGPARRPVVLVHGTPSTLFNWSELIHGGPGLEPSARGGLRRDRDVYAIEVIGHGIAAGVPTGTLTFDRCARFVVAALAELGLGPVHLVGSSYGGEFAWRAALEAPDMLASLTLLDSSGVRRREADWLSEEVLMREQALAIHGWVLNSRERVRSALLPHFDALPGGVVEEFFLLCENAPNWHGMIDLARDENGAREAELSGLRTPTLLLWGERDLAYPPGHYAQRFADLLPDARLVVLDDTGHYPHLERPARVLAELRGFFEEIES